MSNERHLLQRDFYKLLLRMEGETESPDKALSEALSLMVGITQSQLGYVELRDLNNHVWWSTHQLSDNDVDLVRQRISSGIIAETLTRGETIVTPSAFLDERFKDNHSVRTARIEAVLCAPISDHETKGVIYLESNRGFGFDADDHVTEAELFSRKFSPLLKQFKRQLLGTPSADGILESSKAQGMVGHSDAWLQVLKEASTVAHFDVTLLLTGETGTGKTQLARYIHALSSRREASFVHVNCANLPDTLVESELFGAVRGAHSGAYADLPGKIEAAAGGTLFLDEVGELPMPVQAKFLQFVEEGVYYPLGALTPKKVDARIITASNIHFDEAIEAKTFRADLFYRLSVVQQTLPSLDKRREDIAELVSHFTEKHCRHFNIPLLTVTPDTLDDLSRRHYPGNIRQLENLVQRAIVRASTAGSVTITGTHTEKDRAQQAVAPSDHSYREGKEEWEREFILKHLRENRWNVSQTARKLGVSRSQLNNLVKQHQLEREFGSAS